MPSLPPPDLSTRFGRVYQGWGPSYQALVRRMGGNTEPPGEDAPTLLSLAGWLIAFAYGLVAVWLSVHLAPGGLLGAIGAFMLVLGLGLALWRGWALVVLLVHLRHAIAGLVGALAKRLWRGSSTAAETEQAPEMPSRVRMMEAMALMQWGAFLFLVPALLVAAAALVLALLPSYTLGQAGQFALVWSAYGLALALAGRFGWLWIPDSE